MIASVYTMCSHAEMPFQALLEQSTSPSPADTAYEKWVGIRDTLLYLSRMFPPPPFGPSQARQRLAGLDQDRCKKATQEEIPGETEDAKDAEHEEAKDVREAKDDRQNARGSQKRSRHC